MTDFNYKAYLASREWALLREQVRERSGGVCERCHERPLTATHHLTYERIGQEELTDLLGVCRKCHEYLGGRSDLDPALTTSERRTRHWSPSRIEILMGIAIENRWDVRVPADWAADMHLLLLFAETYAKTKEMGDILPVLETAISSHEEPVRLELQRAFRWVRDTLGLYLDESNRG